ncbi:MAG: relaxase/mobilization nuclease domain-containing protein [Pseudobacter sp.]|uniref:relaxase/mobilization nuclease domain-containing protein n=1 Tax=Pseudobacter sp. TaxID=2045420 RepID=UPI003F7FCB22
MVAVVKPIASLRHALHYNENKVKQQVARLIHSGNFAKDTDALSFRDKLGTIQKFQQLSTAAINTLHITLNFPPEEQHSKEKLQQITERYLQLLGYSQQPYLVYQHFDSNHPHVHIVTTNIQANGKRLPTHNIGKVQSEQARKAVEQEFGLTKADDAQRSRQMELKAINPQKIVYGKAGVSGTKRAITNVLDHVLKSYKYASLPELNAVLKNYNVIAHQGGNNSRTARHNGLYYQVLNEQGKTTGVPIPASDIYSKPTMKWLTPRFTKNHQDRQPFKQRIRNAVDLALLRPHTHTITALQDALKKENIQLVLRQNDQGTIYGITYIDHQKKCVFNGSDLGKPYSANQLQQRIGQLHTTLPSQPTTQQQQSAQHPPAPVEPMSAYHTSSAIPATTQLSSPALTAPLAYNSNHPTTEGPLAAELRQEPHKRRKKKYKQ